MSLWVERAERVHVKRVIHTLKCIMTYIKMVVRPEENRRRDEEKSARRKRNALWNICAM